MALEHFDFDQRYRESFSVSQKHALRSFEKIFIWSRVFFQRRPLSNFMLIFRYFSIQSRSESFKRLSQRVATCCIHLHSDSPFDEEHRQQMTFPVFCFLFKILPCCSLPHFKKFCDKKFYNSNY